LQRAGNRRYYRPSDAVLVRRIHSLLNEQGYTIRGVQKLLSQKGGAGVAEASPPSAPQPIAPAPVLVVNQPNIPPVVRAELKAIRDSLIGALATDME
jgi:DNA-binding transcriptional MerR regulator